jgi:hypothetical protein
MNQVFKLSGSLITIEIEPHSDKKNVSFRMVYGANLPGQRKEINTMFSLEELRTIVEVMQNSITHCDMAKTSSISLLDNATLTAFSQGLNDKL